MLVYCMVLNAMVYAIVRYSICYGVVGLYCMVLYVMVYAIVRHMVYAMVW